MAETARAILGLDLVISVDTAVAHLAATLGCSTWLVLPTLGDWRWLLEREDSPWYPSMRIFRQHRYGDWGEPMRRVARELAKLVGAR
jgi:ADP-heptose:LPS heptosyltransferase